MKKICLTGILAVFFLSVSVPLFSQNPDSLALVALYNSTDGDNWTNHENWLSGPLNTWYGVTLKNGRVIAISLADNNLSGTIPAEIGNLNQLTDLSLIINQQLTGTIPAEIGNLTQLTTLSLGYNQLTGAIPAEIGNLTQLTTLFLEANQLTGTIPAEIGDLTQLEYLFLFDNQLTGAIPTEIGNLTQLKRLSLHNNQLTGSVPVGIAHLTQLEYLYISTNHLTDLPDLSSLSSLNRCYITNNKFTFEDIEPNVGLSDFSYSPQDSVGETQDTTLFADETLTLSVEVGGSANQYQWKKNGNAIDLATSSSYTVGSFGNELSGTYSCDITNTIATELTLHSRPWVIKGLTVFEKDSLALITLYNSTDGTNWTNHENWLSGPLNTWFGVTLQNGRVIQISLTNNNLSGTIPAEIGDMTQLTSLYLYSNQLTGAIPIEIGNLTQLTSLSFHNNQLTGDIPAEIGNLTQLTGLYLCENQLTGAIPAEIGNLTQLKSLYLYNNQLTGGIPAEIWNLTQLTHLLLSDNQLTGSIPAQIGDLTQLESLSLSHNQLTGGIPAEIGNLINIAQFSLSHNQLTGAIPSEIGYLANLKDLRFSDNQLTGSIPVGIGNLTQLINLSLSNNQLTGSIPAEIGNLINITQFSLSYNQLTGAVPSEIGSLTNLNYLILSNNQLSGTIPAEIGNLTQLTSLSLSDNQFTGSIPVEIGNLTQLIDLSLSDNQLTGSVPVEIVNLTQLEYLYISKNHLTDLPDLSSMNSLNGCQSFSNQLTFEDIEPNIGLANFNYSPQDSVGETQDTTLLAGDPLTLSVNVGGSANQYQWFRDGHSISGAPGSTYKIVATALTDSGSYYCMITNTIATGLTLVSKPITVHIHPAMGVADRSEKAPAQFMLHQNYPNPFNPKTSIQFDVKETCQVRLSVYNIIGQEVANLVHREYSPGSYQVQFNASGLSSGLYFYKIQMGDFADVKKMMILE